MSRLVVDAVLGSQRDLDGVGDMARDRVYTLDHPEILVYQDALRLGVLPQAGGGSVTREGDYVIWIAGSPRGSLRSALPVAQVDLVADPPVAAASRMCAGTPARCAAWPAASGTRPGDRAGSSPCFRAAFFRHCHADGSFRGATWSRVLVVAATFRWASSWKRMMDRYWVPRSAPGQCLVVGSCARKRVQDVQVAHPGRVEGDLHDLRVPGAAGAHHTSSTHSGSSGPTS